MAVLKFPNLPTMQLDWSCIWGPIFRGASKGKRPPCIKCSTLHPTPQYVEPTKRRFEILSWNGRFWSRVLHIGFLGPTNKASSGTQWFVNLRCMKLENQQAYLRGWRHNLLVCTEAEWLETQNKYKPSAGAPTFSLKCKAPFVSLYRMNHSSKILSQTLVQLCLYKGIDHIVLSRAPKCTINHRLSGNSTFKNFSIVDERCAAFFGLGMAQQLGKPVWFGVPSGSALLNYYPADCDFFSHIPLLWFPGRSPFLELIDVGDRRPKRIWKSQLLQVLLARKVRNFSTSMNRGNPKALNIAHGRVGTVPSASLSGTVGTVWRANPRFSVNVIRRN